MQAGSLHYEDEMKHLLKKLSVLAVAVFTLSALHRTAMARDRVTSELELYASLDQAARNIAFLPNGQLVFSRK